MVYKIETDLAIIGGGFMGLAIAHQAASRGLKSIVLENGSIKGHHYMTGLIAPRADYLPFDFESTEKTAFECARWAKLFPNAIKPQLFILPINNSTPYGFHCLKALMEFYDKITASRLNLMPRGHYRINQSILEKMEPNLRKGHFKEALAFYELTADPQDLLQEMYLETARLDGLFQKIQIRDIVAYNIDKDRIKEIFILGKNGESIDLRSGRDSLIVINAAGPWMGEVARGLDIELPIEFSLGLQLALPIKFCFQSAIINFDTDGKYMICMQKQNHLQIGPTNTKFNGNPYTITDRTDDVDSLLNSFKSILEPNYDTGEPAVKSAGLRVNLRLPFCPDTNRPFIFNTGYENYFAVYPGKTALALSTADDLLDKISGKENKPHYIAGDKKIPTVIKLNLISLRSLYIFGCYLIKYLVRLILKPLT